MGFLIEIIGGKE